MFRLCRVQTSVDSLQKNDITKNQSERHKTIELRLSRAQFSIRRLHGGILLVDGEVEVHEDIDELRSKTVRKWPKALRLVQITVEHQDCPFFTVFLT